MENHFYPLSNIDGEEDAWRIDAVVPPPIVSLPLAPARHQHTLHFCTILRRIGRETSGLEATILHDLRVATLRRL